MRVLGIDPGVSGALAILKDKQLLGLYDMPVGQLRIGKSNKKEVLPHDLAAFIRQQIPLDMAVLEYVAARPGQGVTSMFRFGLSQGVVIGVLASLHVPFLLVTPATWKRHAGLTGQPKDRSRQKAMQLWPTHAQHFSRKRDNGRADAALLALHYVEKSKS